MTHACDILCLVDGCSHKAAAPVDDVIDEPLGSMELTDSEMRLRDPYLHRSSYKEDWS